MNSELTTEKKAALGCAISYYLEQTGFDEAEKDNSICYNLRELIEQFDLRNYLSEQVKQRF